MYTYTVRLFAGLADLFGSSVLTISVDRERLTPAELKAAIVPLRSGSEAAVASSFVARNQAYAGPEESLFPGDEIALIPPVSGGQPDEDRASADGSAAYRLTYDRISVEEVSAQVSHPSHGAGLVFVGTTREWTQGQRTVRLEYEAYEPMALATMKQIGDEIAERWPGALCAITHRLGVVEIGDASVVIAVSLPHRAAAYEASRYAIERLKQIVPIWKKEIWEDGSEWKGHQLGPWNPLDTPAKEAK